MTAEQQPILTVADLDPQGEAYFTLNYGGQIHLSNLPIPAGSYSLTFGIDHWWAFSPFPLRGHFRVEILPAPKHASITPANLSGCIGGTAGFQVQVQGEEPLAYQWYFNKTNLLTGETNPRLSLINLATNNAGQYSATISNQFGGTTSPAATLQVFDACVGLQLARQECCS